MINETPQLHKIVSIESEALFFCVCVFMLQVHIYFNFMLHPHISPIHVFGHCGCDQLHMIKHLYNANLVATLYLYT